MIRRRVGELLLVGVILTGCAGPDDEAEVTSEADEPAAVVAPVDELTIAVPTDVGPLNIFAQHEEALTELVYDKLLAPSPYVDAPQPWLATEIAAIDPATWQVALRDDVTWHDGERFTAADVAFTIEYFKRAPTGRWTHHVSEVPTIERVEVVDDTTVRFHCASACPFLGSVTLADLPIIPEHIWAEVDEPRQRTGLPVGTGPYELEAYEPGNGYRFVANDEYFAGPALVATLVMPVIPDPSTTFTAMRSGEIDAADRQVPPELLETFGSLEQIEVVTTHRLDFPVLQLNYERPPFDQPELRRALNLAVDRDALLETVWLGQGRPATQGYVHPDTPWAAPDVGASHAPTDARGLLDDLGITDADGDGIRDTGDGEPLAFEIAVASTEPTHGRAAELLAEQFAAVGVDVDVSPLDPGALSELFSSREFDAYISDAPVHGTADPTQFIMSHRSGYLWDLPEVPYPEMAALIADWMATTTIEARIERSFEMQRLYDRQPTHIPLYYPDGALAHDGSYAGWVESPAYGIVHKWSFLPREVACAVNALVASAC